MLPKGSLVTKSVIRDRRRKGSRYENVNLNRTVASAASTVIHKRASRRNILVPVGRADAHEFVHAHVYQPSRPVSLGDYRVRTAALDLGVWDPGWLYHFIHSTLSTEPVAEATTGTKGYPSLGQCPRDA